MTVADIQKAHFDAIQRRYEAHYDDTCSRRYRDRFFHERMFRGVELAGKTVLEAIDCGSGQTTSFLLSKGATVTGLDVSEESIASFRARWPSCRAIRASVLESNLESEAFDLIVVVGGLHHLHPHISAATRVSSSVVSSGAGRVFLLRRTAPGLSSRFGTPTMVPARRSLCEE